MVSLLDINVLIALLDADHADHRRARAWFIQHAGAGWASCSQTQNGCVRIMSQTGYVNPLPLRQVMERLEHATRSALHVFWRVDRQIA